MAAGGVLAVAAIVGLPLLAPIVGVVGGQLRRWWRREGRPKCLVVRGCRKEGRQSLHLLRMTNAVFLLQEIGLGVEEGGWGIHGGEDGDRLTELVVQAT